jgi:hypothetical protein
MIFKKGDKVYDYAYGWGEVIKVKLHTTFTYPIVVMFTDENCISYTIKGQLEEDGEPTLSFTEYTLEGFSQVRPKEEKPLNRWYVDDRFPAFICFYGIHKTYGLSYTGDWSIWKGVHVPDGNYKLATDEQILEKLSAYATSIGIMAGATFVALGRDFRIKIEDKPSIGFTYNTEYNSLLFDGWLIMRDGKWVAVVEETKTLAEEIQAIKKHLGI